MSYERWCAMQGFGARLAGDTSPTAQERADAKRARKAAKRRRDAELTRLGRKASRIQQMTANSCRPSAPIERWDEGRFWALAAETSRAWDRLHAIRRGEVQP